MAFVQDRPPMKYCTRTRLPATSVTMPSTGRPRLVLRIATVLPTVRSSLRTMVLPRVADSSEWLLEDRASRACASNLDSGEPARSARSATACRLDPAVACRLDLDLVDLPSEACRLHLAWPLAAADGPCRIEAEEPEEYPSSALAASARTASAPAVSAPAASAPPACMLSSSASHSCRGTTLKQLRPFTKKVTLTVSPLLSVTTPSMSLPRLALRTRIMEPTASRPLATASSVVDDVAERADKLGSRDAADSSEKPSARSGNVPCVKLGTFIMSGIESWVVV
mmetsp:Transcript_33293/g.75443  ORF Transcript_33293/g.75443 Transcript_33293/m.75443 type:complete len:282 (+) Transcript_33293:188-1033(+)